MGGQAEERRGTPLELPVVHAAHTSSAAQLEICKLMSERSHVHVTTGQKLTPSRSKETFVLNSHSPAACVGLF